MIRKTVLQINEQIFYSNVKSEKKRGLKKNSRRKIVIPKDCRSVVSKYKPEKEHLQIWAIGCEAL